MKKNTIDMTSGSPARHILHFTMPLILTNMGQQLYMIVDGAIVGRGVGVQALAGVGARILMSKCFIGYIGADALFLYETASWLGAMLCVFLPYFYYRRKLLR
jgi:hypothetical protein